MNSNTREDLIAAFLSSLTEDELRFCNKWIDTRLTNTKKLTSLPKKISILYGTETGNAKKIANEFALSSKKKGILAKVVGTDTYKLTDLAKEEYLFVIISTQGEGEPPISAKKFYEYLRTTTEQFPKIKYAVLGLGDTSYPLYCQTGIDIDTYLEKTGAERILTLSKADVDYKPTSLEWMESVFHKLSTTGSNGTVTIKKEESAKEKISSYTGKVRTSINLNDNNSEKKTFHIELASDIPIQYKSGDIAVIQPHNDPQVVQEIISFTKSNTEKVIQLTKKSGSLIDLLTSYLSITYLSENSLKKIADTVSIPIKETRLDLLDLIVKYEIRSSEKLEAILQLLNPISPRQYSIASSSMVNEEELHLTVALDTFRVEGKQKFGLCSNYLCKIEEGDEISFTIKRNPHFYLPDSDKDIIMIGPGTGIAPFRAFVSERSVTQAEGKNWLFFGDRKFTENFLYQTEWQEHFAMGTLNKINLAWSRDGKEKYYVQDEIRKEGKEFLQWLENGAYLYVCGAKDPMSIDVEKAILDVISTYKKVSPKKAKAYLEKMEEEHRYLKDVY
jgi:sulfite reductase (NADPH) flavoprotein alpha-component